MGLLLLVLVCSIMVALTLWVTFYFLKKRRLSISAEAAANDELEQNVTWQQVVGWGAFLLLVVGVVHAFKKGPEEKLAETAERAIRAHLEEQGISNDRIGVEKLRQLRGSEAGGAFAADLVQHGQYGVRDLGQICVVFANYAKGRTAYKAADCLPGLEMQTVESLAQALVVQAQFQQ